jgi:hypothetical protein
MYGVTDEALDWLTLYLVERTQYVKINDAESVHKPLKTGLPQGSLLGPFAFPSYTAPLFSIARTHKIEMHMYADDTQLYLPFKPQDYDTALTKMENCLIDIRRWMNENMLKLNDSKTEFMIIGKKSSLRKLPSERLIHMGDECIMATEKAKNIGVVFDSNLSMAAQINNVCRSAYSQLYNIGKIRPYITKKSTITLVHALVTSKLDTCNSVLYGCTDTLLHKLQMVQHNAARLIYRKRKGHITPLLIELHWLPVEARIDYKICLLVFKCQNKSAPSYLQDLVTSYEPRRENLRSATSHRMDPPIVKQKRAGERSFMYAAAKVWNKLPLHVKTSPTIETFKTSLKTYRYLFKDYYKV